MFFVLFIAILFFVLYGLNLALLRTLNQRWWKKPRVRRTYAWMPLAALACGGIWALGARADLSWVVLAGAGLLSALFVYLAGFLIAFLVTGAGHALEKLYDLLRYRLPGSGPPPSPERRRFLRLALAGVPIFVTAPTTHGLISSGVAPRIPRVPLHYPNLPPPLEGLKILQISDVHIGPYRSLEDLEALMARAAAQQPDLVLVTGDVCDHLPSYLEALNIIADLQPPLGTFASMGNHEYFRFGRIEAVRRTYARTTIPLLVDQGLTLPVGGRELYLSGADDPQFMRRPEAYQKLRGFVEKSQEKAPSDAFRILMSHRSQALDYAAPLGVDLVLSGHTHGFQLGAGGRSLFDSWMPERYIWGHYQKGGSQLYTSAGVGHWFPFRLGCPPEAPLFTLQRS